MVWFILWVYAIISKYALTFEFLPSGKQLLLGDYLFFYVLPMEHNQASVEMIKNFTPIYSIFYFFVVITGLFALCLFRIRTMNIGGRG